MSNAPDTDIQPVGDASPLIGTVVAVQANYYQVWLDETGDKGELGAEEENLIQNPKSKIQNPKSSALLCTRRARLKKIGQQVMVGDRVEVVEPDWNGGRGAIADVLPRQNQLDRPPIANAEKILLVFALAEPNLDPYQLSKFLVKAESTELGVVLCLNKSDLLSQAEIDSWRDRISSWGYPPRFISIRNGKGLNEVSWQLKNKITVIAGPSGVGKSSLINTLIPTARLRVGEVSGKLGRGRHTTRHVELFELPAGGQFK